MTKAYIDVREPDEYALGHVKGALNVPLSKLLQKTYDLSTIDKESALVVYCRSGSRATVVMRMLQQQGYTDVTNGINQATIELAHQAR